MQRISFVIPCYRSALTIEKVVKDYQKALSWFKRAAKNDSGAAYYMISYCYQMGLGVKANEDAMMNNLKEAAELGDELALCDMGDYYQAKGDLERAFECYEDASKKGYSTAIIKLAQCYFSGKGIEQDRDYAYDLASKLADKGSDEAKEFLSKYYNE